MPLNPMVKMQVEMIKKGLKSLSPEVRAEAFGEILKAFCIYCGAERHFIALGGKCSKCGRAFHDAG